MMRNPLAAYTHWLHTRWPAGMVERGPLVQPNGSTNVPGVFVVGDLTGVPLLKFSADTGTRAVMTIDAEATFQARDTSDPAVIDIAIVGGGVSGFAAAKEAHKRGLSYVLIEAAQPFSTIVNFPKKKPIFTYPTDMTPAGDLQFNAKSHIKEGLLEDLQEQTLDQGIAVRHAKVDRIERSGKTLTVKINGDDNSDDLKAHRVIIAIGRSGNYRKLGVPGEERDKVYNRLHDAKTYCDQHVAVIGGGDSALETANALAQCGAQVTLSYRKAQFNRPKPENIQRLKQHASGTGQEKEQKQGSVTLMMASQLKTIGDDSVVITDTQGNDQTLKNDSVFAMIGREAPLDFFRKSGITVRGDKNATWWITLGLMLATFTFFYHWKKPGTWLPIAETFEKNGWFPHNLGPWLSSLAQVFNNPANPLGTLKLSAAGLPGKTGGSPGFWFSLLYCTLIVTFGIKRIRRRRTPYVTWQTLSLIIIQCVPLFLLPYLFMPWLGHLGLFDSGLGQTVADALFPLADYDPHGREYWRAFGLILAWPLFLWNVFTDQPQWTWLGISLVQTFVLIPTAIYFWGKGVYCGWICSCGAMAETLGDTHRHKMPHGPFWNRLNMIGQVFLLLCFGLLALRVLAWTGDVSWAQNIFKGTLNTSKYGGYLPGLNYAWFVDLFWAGILGFGLYFHFSGRVWCRFACPLAALMHIYARFSRFGIVAEKEKCISCNVCTSVCHQGIDIMSFANKGLTMQDPQCVRCSACVQSCPTGVLAFGQIDGQGATLKLDPPWLAASPLRMAQAATLTINGQGIPS